MERKNEIMDLLKDLHRISGLRISLHDCQFRELLAYPAEKAEFCRLVQRSEEGKRICVCTDREAFAKAAAAGTLQVYHCHFGLWEAINPLYHYGVLSGYLMMGQILDNVPGSKEAALDAGRPFASSAQMRGALSGMPACSEEDVRTYARIMTVCAEYLTLTGAVRPTGELGNRVEDYLRAHFADRITLASLATHFRCSRSTLISAFAQNHSMTVFAFLTDIRLEEAQRLLRETELPVGEVGVRCGFADQGYFTKVYKKKFGLSASGYRRFQKNRQNG